MKLCNLNPFFRNLSLLTLIFAVSCSNGSKGLDRNLDLSSVENYRESLHLALNEATEVERQVLSPTYTGSMDGEFTLERYLFSDLVPLLDGPDDPFERAKWVEGMHKRRAQSEKTSLRNIFIKLIKQNIAQTEKNLTYNKPSLEKLKGFEEKKAVVASFLADTEENINESGDVEFSRELLISNNSPFKIQDCYVSVGLLAADKALREAKVSTEYIARGDNKPCAPIRAGEKMNLKISFVVLANSYDMETMNKYVNEGKQILIDFKSEYENPSYTLEGLGEASSGAELASKLEVEVAYQRKVLATIEGKS